ncbi:hypothetical protein EN795_37095, partial [bacterium M00.F.Ca.ET.152.01.1.1]
MRLQPAPVDDGADPVGARPLLPPCGGRWIGAQRRDDFHRRDPSHPPLACRPSPPQGGRSDVATAFANHQRCKVLGRA